MQKNTVFVVVMTLFLSFQTAQAQYVRDWLILGSFEAKPEKASLDFEYLENEAETNAFGGQEMNGNTWIQSCSYQSKQLFYKRLMEE